MARAHQPDQSTFRTILPEEIDWQSFPRIPPTADAQLLASLIANAGLRNASELRVLMRLATRRSVDLHAQWRAILTNWCMCKVTCQTTEGAGSLKRFVVQIHTR